MWIAKINLVILHYTMLLLMDISMKWNVFVEVIFGCGISHMTTATHNFDYSNKVRMSLWLCHGVALWMVVLMPSVLVVQSFSDHKQQEECSTKELVFYCEVYGANHFVK